MTLSTVRTEGTLDGLWVPSQIQHVEQRFPHAGSGNALGNSSSLHDGEGGRVGLAQ